ncbi:glycerol-3-phosphate acyltransferase [Candidatus Aminicenantes bacterium AC-708-M15]|jgi:glycerol-3-phosphate acyltransferase PlsY|nr:glycerol-3-phosphate acyltransferase [SCandidatus Aminicenantes bacterium Aminicenantia_JdfR_composite]MCP2598364.1 glycerol-3-phosphate acyltransferase [Candidatus Aminicenantes bacterium AC-335-L06]MCP2604268.1 glycerol-3-phosphate acyltransferase [Candidatus Aminicenantes bacterium AC-708-M15]MCP2618915.1 glycerol-3-phosphate acyltransferase [Candidatus Aminicenantes bacterium AC-335-A11]MCP2620786.1 glycerol-3-phosphate acyltransferase [Candidatus Aminicenantes bacterium AC-334-E05]
MKKSIFTLGSGNAGAGNVGDILGWKWGILVGIMDFAKGVSIVLLARAIGLNLGLNEVNNIFFILGAILCICGHNWSIFLGFKGGTGLATSIGILFMFYPIYLLISLIIGLILNSLIAMELAVFFGGSIYIIIMLLTGKNLWISFLPLFLAIPIIIKRIYWIKKSSSFDFNFLK